MTTKLAPSRDARQSYHNAMENHFKNNVFLTPTQLQEFHVQAKGIVMKKCELRTTLNHFQRADLDRSLDALMEIYEKKNDMSLNSRDSGMEIAPAIGIDLGTTHCCVAVYSKGKVHIIPNQEQGGIKLIPSYVAFDPDGSETYGTVAKENAYKNPENTIYDAKRIIGRKITDPELQSDMAFWPFVVREDEGVPKVMVNGDLLHPEQISGRLLAHCRVMAEKFLKLQPGTIKNAVITVAAYFNDGQRQATVDAGELAGYEYILTILNEPTAAAIAYSLQRLDTEPKKILVYDLGDRSFDVAVLNMKPKEIEVLGVNGDSHLGGDDFVKKIMEYCASCFKTECGIDLFDGKDYNVKHERDEARRRFRRLKTNCQKAMRDLKSGRKTQIYVGSIVNGQDLIVMVTREKFEELNMAYFEKSIKLVEKILQDVGLRKEEIDDVTLVGSSSTIPKVQEMLSNYFYGTALNCSIDPQFVVAYGAAVQAAMLNGKEAKTKMGLAIQDDDHKMGKIVSAGAKSNVPGKQEDHEKKYEVMQNIASYVETKVKSLLPDVTQEWLQHHLSPRNIADIKTVYDHILAEGLLEGHKHVSPTLWNELDRLVDHECRTTCTNELNAVARQIQKFYLGMKEKVDVVNGVSCEDLEKWGKEEMWNLANSDPLQRSNLKLVEIGCLKLIDYFRIQNEEILSIRNVFAESLIRDGLHFYDEEMKRLLKVTTYPSDRLQQIHAGLSRKLIKALDQSIKLMTGEDKVDALKSGLEKCFTLHHKQNNTKLKNILEQVHNVLESSQSSYASKIEEVIKENPEGLEEAELHKRHLEIVSETEAFLEREIGNNIIEGEPLDKHLQSLQAYVQEYLKYISEINNLNLKRGKLRQEQEARMLSIRSRLNAKEDDRVKPKKLPKEAEASNTTPDVIPGKPSESDITATSESKEELLKQCQEMKEQLDSGNVFRIKSGVVKCMFAEKIDQATRIAQDPDSTFAKIQEQVETVKKWSSKYRK